MIASAFMTGTTKEKEEGMEEGEKNSRGEIGERMSVSLHSSADRIAPPPLDEEGGHALLILSSDDEDGN